MRHGTIRCGRAPALFGARPVCVASRQVQTVTIKKGATSTAKFVLLKD
ncbi:hypothetical protein KGQ19_07490 [Catenulispora sp. NL8]|uniref:Uncharacterized protein n=1 Tax=Catenulispora pinistramenti TaxID=2705254 RepID=A0ABS5KKZ3_9ACTN|nr:hypothetical protein [Catenulispora pinistramenti]MBS2546707.1 hypothetical protein [Catenulispora pinistramenti]